MKIKASSCSADTCRRRDHILCSDDACDIEIGVVACVCEHSHDRPYWTCPIHGHVTTVDT